VEPEAEEIRRTREIRAEIDQTREEMSETIDAIQEKLRPGNVVAEARDRVKSATTEKVRQMADSATETAQNAYDQTRRIAGEFADGARGNALPAALICVGTAWFLIDRYRQRDRSADNRRWPTYGSRHENEAPARRARNQFARLLTDNPLIVGAAAVAVGAAIGMALPETERENEWLGESRDNVLDKAQDMARNVATRAQQAVGEAAGEITKKVVSGKE
jgi:hypothetical protein